MNRSSNQYIDFAYKDVMLLQDRMGDLPTHGGTLLGILVVAALLVFTLITPSAELGRYPYHLRLVLGLLLLVGIYNYSIGIYKARKMRQDMIFRQKYCRLLTIEWYGIAKENRKPSLKVEGQTSLIQVSEDLLPTIEIGDQLGLWQCRFSKLELSREIRKKGGQIIQI